MVSLEERKELLNLILTEGNKKEFKYKGYECLINRVQGRWHLCRYIKYTPKSKVEKDIFNDNFHCGVTYGNYKEGWLGEEWIGFDCMHLDDKTPHDVS